MVHDRIIRQFLELCHNLGDGAVVVTLVVRERSVGRDAHATGQGQRCLRMIGRTR